MASSGGGGGGGDVPAERAAAAVNDLMEAREGGERLRGWLQEQSSEWTELMDGMLHKLTSALSALDTGCAAGASAAGSGDGVLRPTAESSARRTRKRSFSRRSQRSSSTRVTHTLTDGHVWRKYGQKEIQNSPHPRSYYRCTHKSERGCDAKRQVQACETDPPKFTITYYGEHTCTTPPVTIVDANDGRGRNNLVSFARTFPQLSDKEGGAATTQHLSSSWCASDRVFNSSGADPFVQTDELAVVVGSAGRTKSTVGSVRDYGGLGDRAGGSQGGGTSSFPSSPSSIEFMMNSLGSLGDIDDDHFPCDP